MDGHGLHGSVPCCATSPLDMNPVALRFLREAPGGHLPPQELMSRPTAPSGVLALFLVATLGIGQACGDDPVAPNKTISVALVSTSGSAPQGGTNTSVVTVTGGGGFVTTPTITVSGAPAGVTASVSTVVTASGVSTATVTFTAALAATPGVYPITINATGTGVAAVSATYTLTVTPFSFSTAFAPTALSVAQGSSATSSIAITRNNLAGNIGLAISGLPAGVTATLSPDLTSGTASTLTVTAAPGAALGTANLVLTGTSLGAADQTSTLALTITPITPIGVGVVLSATPATLDVHTGASGSQTINLARTSFTVPVTLTVEGLPAGVSAAFVPATTTGTASTMTLTATVGVAPGTYHLIIRGTGPGMDDATMAFVLTIS